MNAGQKSMRIVSETYPYNVVLLLPKKFRNKEFVIEVFESVLER